MHTHANARLTQRGRLRLVSQHLNHHRPLAELAAEAGISLRCAYKWLARYRSGGANALVGLPRFQGQVDRGHAMTTRMSIDELTHQDQASIHGAAKGGGC